MTLSNDENIYAFDNYYSQFFKYNCIKNIQNSETLVLPTELTHFIDEIYFNLFFEYADNISSDSNYTLKESINVRLNTYLITLINEFSEVSKRYEKNRKYIIDLLSKNTDGSAGKTIFDVIIKRIKSYNYFYE